jgi:hypothetical protein
MMLNRHARAGIHTNTTEVASKSKDMDGRIKSGHDGFFDSS